MDPLLTQAEIDIQERIAELPSDVAEIITEGTLDAVVFGIQTTYALTPEQTTALENEIIFVLTTFFLPEDFIDNVQESLNIDRKTAEAINTEVQTNIFGLVEDFFEMIKSNEDAEGGATPVTTKKEELRNLAQVFEQPKAQQEALLATEIQTVEESTTPINPQILTENVEPLRTMEGDMNRIHGYGAYAVEHPEILTKDEDGTAS